MKDNKEYVYKKKMMKEWMKNSWHDFVLCLKINMFQVISFLFFKNYVLAFKFLNIYSLKGFLV